MGRRKTKQKPLISGWAFYGRTSDEDAQAPERSLASQLRLCTERLIAGSGTKLIEEYRDIYTGRSSDRKDYQRLLADANEGKFSHVAIAFVDRFGRNDVEGIRAFDELNKSGIDVRIATYPSLDPTTPDGRMIVTMLFGVARFESDRIGQRSKEGMHTKVLGGDWAWKAPDGYVNCEEKLSNLPESEKLKHAKYKRWVELNPEQGKVWRYAWDLLLADHMSLRDICEAMHSKGYRLSSGAPFVQIKSDGSRHHRINIVSRIFHSWFYAGWLVLDTDSLTIVPKTVRGNWEPIVSTEEFESGLAILAKRNQDRNHKKKHFYLLQGHLFLEFPNGIITKLTCSTPNINRARGGVPYYCIGSSGYNFLCHRIDDQIPKWMYGIQISESCVPLLRQLYKQQLDTLMKNPRRDERSALEMALKDLADEELRCARLHAKQQISDETWETLWTEWQEQRNAIKVTLEAMMKAGSAHIETLDDALRLIGKAGILFEKLSQEGQQDLLRHMVKRVVINPEGQILRMELRTPFCYLQQLFGTAKGFGETEEPRKGSKAAKTKTSRTKSTGSSYVQFGSRGRIRTYNPSVNSRLLCH
jgi:DNA invertase Pin-like site-specific DNA recombinase